MLVVASEVLREGPVSQSIHRLPVLIVDDHVWGGGIDKSSDIVICNRLRRWAFKIGDGLSRDTPDAVVDWESMSSRVRQRYQQRAISWMLPRQPVNGEFEYPLVISREQVRPHVGLAPSGIGENFVDGKLGGQEVRTSLSRCESESLDIQIRPVLQSMGNEPLNCVRIAFDSHGTGVG
ncbi:hypothetical protein HLB23_24335 [Nocardia uniformis]|uniref:Uncharacterized protein n=1 Tax=Nocardia uniformis TaxID=53432 RepID=A0A849CCZ2_9NOCA|nr:hypothetical protein [Nocardia uniformis]NNH72949.1 hypothetical protein [Nocardia uniformis]